MKKLIAIALFIAPFAIIGVTYKQCVGELNSLRSQFELKRDECRQTQETEYDSSLRELIEKQKGEIESLKEKHITEREELKNEYDKKD